MLSAHGFRIIRGALAAASIGVLSSATWVHGQSVGRLSLDDALGIAQGNAPAINAATKGIEAARDMAVIAGQLPDPVLRLGVENLPANGPDAWKVANDFMTMRRVGVMQEYVSTEKRELLRTRVELDAQRLDAARHRLRANLRQDVAVAWFDLYYAGKSRELIKRLEAEIELQSRTLDPQIRAGKATVGDAAAASAVLLQIQDRLSVADKQERVARIGLSRWLGPDAAREPGAAPAIDTLALEPNNPAVLASVPSLREHRTESEVARADLAITRSNRRSNWSWELAYSQRGPAYSNMVSFGVSIPLTFNAANKQDREIAAKQSQVEQAHALHEDMRRETEVALASAYTEWRSLIDRRNRLSGTMPAVARQRLELALGSYRSGQGNLAAVLEARRAQVEAQMQLLDLERDAAKMWAQLNFVYVEPSTTQPKAGLP
jgi:outer membrane protein TolC